MSQLAAELGGSHQSDRREFLEQVSATGASMMVSNWAISSPLEMTDTEPDNIPKKPFGKTKERLSILGLGGATLAQSASYRIAEQIVQRAIDAGINFFDNAWEYHEGRSEEWMGKALKGRRDKIFLMTKVCTHGRDKSVAMKQLEESLARLQTDHLDLWQVHEVVYYNDPELIYAKNGVLEALEQAKKQGKVRYVGFTGHKDPEIHLEMLKRGYPFDSVQMPLNCFDASFRSFEQQVLPEVNRRGMAALGMKSMSGGGESLLHGAVTPEEALGYAMTLPVAVTISGIDSIAVLEQNLGIARGFKPFADVRMQQLRERNKKYAGDGHLELYKSSVKFDGETGRQQHGYPPRSVMPL